MFTRTPALESQVVGLLPLILAVVITDALQAVAGIGLIGLKHTGPSLGSTAVWFGLSAAVAVPVDDAAGLLGMWMALACADLLQGVSELGWFVRRSARIGAAAPLTVRRGGAPQQRGARSGARTLSYLWVS
ncbi:hypothetical protein [Streptomyces bauhiniae]|uniref:hypothetical protein n=1 Tax=Streptomyces bauhiniae TaxID=2340725 RepID=UPI0035DE0F0E